MALDRFLDYFAHPSLLGIGLAVLFGVFWLLLYWPPLLKERSLWLVLLFSGLVIVLASAFIQIPLTNLVRNLLRWIVGDALNEKILLPGLIYALIAGFVQEGAKFPPILVLWRRADGELEPRLGLTAGAAAGIAFGVLEAQWVHNTLFASGWNFGTLQSGGLIALLGFWERFIMVGLHASLGALMGYGLTRERGWQSWLLAAILHALASYSSFLLTDGAISYLVVEIYLTAITAVLAVIMLSLRWEK